MPDRLPSQPRHARRAALALLATGAVVAFVVAQCASQPKQASTPSPSPAPNLDTLASQFLALEAHAQADLAAHFPIEIASQPFREALVAWWDAWNQSPMAWADHADTLAGLTSHPNASAHPATFEAHGLNWTRQLAAWKHQGWVVERSRWHLERWQPTPQGPRAGVRFEILARRMPPHPATRATLRGLAWLDAARWTSPASSPEARGHVDVEELDVASESAPAAFAVAADLPIPVPPHSPFSDPLIALDEPDGPSLLMVGAATWFRWRHGQWLSEPLPGLPPERIWAAAVADWNHDGAPDLWLAASDGLRVLPGPRWSGPGILLWKSPARLPHPQSLAVSDIDGDGDLDAFIGQYKVPYQGGQFPTPWHDAMDGFPALLLQDQGPKGWSNITLQSGIGPKAQRRLYSASFADWNDDGRPDLVMASDFAGFDLFQNMGSGRFADITPSLGIQRMGFGMGHWTGDIDGNGRMDLLLVGMDSPVADRMHATGQRHPLWPGDASLRRALTHGNRWLQWDGQRFVPSASGDSMARGGWAWAATLLDVDNDGWPDMHLANGHETLGSTADYEETFWTRDLHVAGSTNNPVTDAFFRASAGRRAASGTSYGGWQHGALFLNQQGHGWRESAWLLGAAIPADQRNAVALDLERDGRMDLAVTTMELWPVRRQRLLILSNRSTPPAHWLGLRFADGPGTGWAIRIRANGRVQERRVTAGESHRSQSAGYVHFGLGPATAIEWLEVRGPNATSWRRIEPTPPVDAWHAVRLAGTSPSEGK